MSNRVDEGHWLDMAAKPGGPPWANAMRGLQAELERARTDAALARCDAGRVERDAVKLVFALLKRHAATTSTQSLSVEYLEYLDGPDLFENLCKLQEKLGR